MTPGRRQTSDGVLHIAEALVQTRSFNAFSYADITCAVGISKASLHQHFATKADLSRCLAHPYTPPFPQG
jgi:TetR/AcrR family transcriptional repressor of nem operon